MWMRGRIILLPPPLTLMMGVSRAASEDGVHTADEDTRWMLDLDLMRTQLVGPV